jgi:hypothetical protein
VVQRSSFVPQNATAKWFSLFFGIQENPDSNPGWKPGNTTNSFLVFLGFSRQIDYIRV